MLEDLKPSWRYVALTVLLALTAFILFGGFLLLQNLQNAKVLMTFFAVVWGLGSVALLYFVLNQIA